MAGFSASEVIDRTPEQVFAFSTSLENAPTWLTKVVRIEPLIDGPMRVGSKFRETRMMGKRECSAVIEVTEHAGPADGGGPPYTHAAQSAAMGVEAMYRYRFSPEGEGRTRVDLEAIVKPTSILGRLMAPLMVKAMKKEDGDQLAHLKRAIESEPAVAG